MQEVKANRIQIIVSQTLFSNNRVKLNHLF